MGTVADATLSIPPSSRGVLSRGAISASDAEAESQNVDLGVFDRIISHIRKLNFSASDSLADASTQQKIFELRLWVYLAEEYLFDWSSKGQALIGLFRVTESDIFTFRGAHVDVYGIAA